MKGKRRPARRGGKSAGKRKRPAKTAAPAPPAPVAAATPVGAALSGAAPLGRAGAVAAGRPPVVIDAATQRRIDVALAAAAPLLLLPLRLEYRVLGVGTPIRVTSAVAELFRGVTNATVRPPLAPPRPPRRRADARVAAAGKLDVRALSLKTHPEIWFRWFPGSDFAERGIAPASEQELQAIAAFDASVGAKPWHDSTDATVVSAWQALTRSLAPARALHLLRNRAATADPKWEERIGKIALLPKRVTLFAQAPGGALSVLASGGDIPAKVRYTPDALNETGWLTNFDEAIRVGMGCRVSDPARVAAALAAEWVIAVGLFSGDAADAAAALLKDAIATGAFEFLTQDTPTNNSGAAASALREPRADIPGFLQRATENERGVLNSPVEQAADLFGEALQIAAASVRNAPGGGDAPLEEARAMLQAVGPVLFDTVTDGIASWRDLDEGEVLDFFADSIAARGTLPAVRFGNNPYGILPVTRIGAAEPFALDAPAEAKIAAFLQKFAELSRPALLDQDAGQQPVIEPGDEDAADKLLDILKLNPVSRRLDVSDTGAATVSALGCAYVSAKGWRARDYLKALREKPLGQLPEPDETDTAAPLLYRLVRLALEKSIVLPVVSGDAGVGKLTLRTMTASGPNHGSDVRRGIIAALNLGSIAQKAAIAGIRREVLAPLQRASARFSSALARLEAVARRPQGDAELEALLMEAVDLFQHRIDAWAAGLAYRRIVKRRRAGRAGLAGGYYGMLGRLRPSSATAGSDGYIQAPSPHQAATAALLRAAHLRHAGGPFSVDLSSARVRRAESILDMLRKGLSLAETLGLAGERWLHDRRKDEFIAALRQKFPLRNANDGTSLEIRLFDGAAFLQGDISVFAVSARPTMTELKAALSDDLDAVSDLVMAEAVHQRAHGQGAAANAWLQVLSGHPVPARPAVVRTARAGHGSSHRVALLLGPAVAPANASPRAIAEPTLAALAATALARFESCSVRVDIAAAAGGPVLASVTASLAGDLALAPIDVVLGGESEIRVRALSFALRRWSGDAALQAKLGPLPPSDIASFLARERFMALRLDIGPVTAASLIALASKLRRMIQHARALEPADLNAAARPERLLTDAVEAELLGAAARELADRGRRLAVSLGADAARAKAALAAFLLKARNYRNGVDAGLPEVELSLRLAEVAAARPALDDALAAVSRYCEPAALRPFATEAAALAPDDFAPAYELLLGRLEAKVARLNGAAQSVSANFPDAIAARRAVAALTEALQATLDGEGLMVLPVVAKRPETTAETNFSQGTAVEPALADWASERSRIRLASGVIAALKDMRAFAVTDKATGADDTTADARSEAEAPRARFFGTFLASRTFAPGAGSYCGLVLDEWAEQRPSRFQTTGIAINYDSPQSEAPNCLLLGEPHASQMRAWSEEDAAAIVSETIGWMQIRALPAQHRLAPGGQLPRVNQVPFKPDSGAGRRRVPVRPLVRASLAGIREGAIVPVALGQPTGLGATGAREISGFNRTEE